MNLKGKKESTDGGRNAVRISRDYDFPRETVFRMFTDPRKAVKFFGPEGAVKLLFELDPRPGGSIRIHDRDSEGNTGKTSGTITEIVVPELLVFRSATTFFSAATPEKGGVPWEALQTIKFEALGPRKSRVTVLVQVLATGSFPGGVQALEEGYMSGWGETLDMLDRELR